MRKYSVIVSDLGGVLLPVHWDIAEKRLNKIQNGLGTEFFKTYFSNYNRVHRKFERHQIDKDEFLHSCLGWLGNKVSASEFSAIYSEIFTVNEDVVSLIGSLKGKYRLVLLSNTNELHEKLGFGNLAFLRMFDRMILSHRVGAIKPEEEIYRAVELYTRVPSSEHLFIDDQEAYVKGALNRGWDAIQFRGYQNLKTELAKRLII